VQGEQRECREAAEQRVGLDEVEEVARPRGVGRDRHAVKKVGEGHAPKQGRQRGAPEDGAIPPGPPRRVVLLPTEFKRHSSKNKRGEHKKERKVEATEDRGVPQGEGGERGPARGDQPDLIAIPDGSDGVDHHAAVHVVSAEERQQDSDAEVEALQEEVSQPEHGDQNEPELLESAG
jgi:hypothetical protein